MPKVTRSAREQEAAIWNCTGKKTVFFSPEITQFSFNFQVNTAIVQEKIGLLKLVYPAVLIAIGAVSYLWRLLKTTVQKNGQATYCKSNQYC